MVTSTMVPDGAEVEFNDYSVPARKLSELLDIYSRAGIEQGSGNGVSTQDYTLKDDGDDDGYATLSTNTESGIKDDYITTKRLSAFRSALEDATKEQRTGELKRKFEEELQYVFDDVKVMEAGGRQDGDVYVFAQLWRFEHEKKQSTNVKGEGDSLGGIGNLDGWELNYFGIYEDIEHEEAPDIDGEGAYMFFLYEEA